MTIQESIAMLKTTCDAAVRRESSGAIAEDF
jgi:hypothetical protein